MVSVSCSVKVHAFQLAAQLSRHGLLSRLYTMAHAQKNPLVARLMSRQDREEIPLDRIHTFWWLAAALKLSDSPHLVNKWFDQHVAQLLKRDAKSQILIGWSGMALQSIRQAKRQGKITVLERGSSHIEFQIPLLEEEYSRLGFSFKRNQAVMDQEVAEYEEADLITVPSKFVEDTFLERGIPGSKLFRNNFGASQYFIPTRPKRKLFTILYLGTLSLRKGIPYFFEALRQLRLSPKDYEVWLVGKVQPEIQRIAGSFNQSNWKWWDHVNHYQLADVISPCSVAVQPSLEEGLSMVIPQIMACGVPVIATTNTGAADVVTDGVDGFVIPIRSPKAIAERLVHLFENPEKLVAMQKAAVERVSRAVTWDQYGDRYAARLQSLLSDR